jgi:DNA-binding response OmpR family regulator
MQQPSPDNDPGRERCERSVVLIEDDPSIAKLTEYVLERAGYTVVTARDGTSGLEAIRSSRPFAVLLDLTLPRLSGDEVCRAVRSDPSIADTFLIVVSARDESDVRKRAAAVGANAYVCKPCDPDDIVEVVDRAFAATQQAASDDPSLHA